MKWVFLLLGLFFILFSWFLFLIGRGITFTHGEYEKWNDAFFEAYRACCFITDLKTAVPFAMIGTACLIVSAWHFMRR